jgi:hypothetical protein
MPSGARAESAATNTQVSILRKNGDGDKGTFVSLANIITVRNRNLYVCLSIVIIICEV